MNASEGISRAQRARIALIALLASFLLVLIASSWPQAVAQDPPTDPPAPTATQAPPPKTTGIETPGVLSRIWHIIKSVGWFWLIFMIMTLALVALVVVGFLDLRMGMAVPLYFVEEFTEIVNRRKFKEAFELARVDNSYLARVMVVGMARLQYGIEDAREAALNTNETIKASKENLIAWLAMLGTLGPLVGLVGTIWGMIGAFMKLEHGANPKQLSTDIAEALSVTFIGIAISVVAIFFYTMFRNQITKISNETSNVADDLLTQMYHNSKKPAPPPTAQPASPAEVRAVPTATAAKPS